MVRFDREREPDPRRALLRGFALPVERFAADRFGAALLREADAPDDFALVDDFGFAREVVFRLGVDLRAPPPEEPVLAPALELISAVHLPDITRCAASATASAISEPNLVALAATLLAACCAVSAASSPASRILRRAAGLALIAAAAAARPAASISLLIAAFASLSTGLLLDFDVEPPDEVRLDVDRVDDLDAVFRGDFAIASLSLSCDKRHFSPVTVPE